MDPAIQNVIALGVALTLVLVIGIWWVKTHLRGGSSKDVDTAPSVNRVAIRGGLKTLEKSSDSVRR